MNESPVQTCLECGEPVRRVIHPVGIVFKGSGFYVNDSRKSTSASKPTDAAGDSKTDSGPAASSGGETEGKSAPKSDGDSSAKKSDGKKESPAAS
jgi:hypothetical protein